MYLSAGPHKNCGLGLIAALFLILVVALLVAAIHQTVTRGAERTSATILDYKALLTAHNGAQLGLNRLYAPVSGAGTCSDTVYAMTDIAGLRNCDASVTCRGEAVRGRMIYTIRGTGTCADGGLTMRREVLVRSADR